MAYARKKLYRRYYRRYYTSVRPYYIRKINKTSFNYKKLNFGRFRLDIPLTLRYPGKGQALSPALYDMDGNPLINEGTSHVFTSNYILDKSARFVSLGNVYSQLKVRGIRIDIKREKEQNANMPPIAIVAAAYSGEVPTNYNGIIEIPKSITVTGQTDTASTYKRLYSRWIGMTDDSELFKAFLIIINGRETFNGGGTVFSFIVRVYCDFKNTFA